MLLLALALALTAPATVNLKPITEPEVSKALGDRIRKTMFHRQLDEKQTAEVRKKVLDELITAELRAQEARRRGLVVPQEPLNQLAAGEEKNAGGPEKFDAMLASFGIDRARYLEIISRPALAARLEDLEARGVATPTADDALARYQANPARYLVPGALKLRSTCVRVDPSSTEKQWQAGDGEARALRDRVMKADFAALAIQQKCDAFAPTGGDLGLVHQGSLDPVMEKAAWGIGDGEITAPVRSLRGWYLLKREATQAPRQASFADVKDSILAELRDERRRAALKQLDERLHAAAKIVLAKQ